MKQFFVNRLKIALDGVEVNINKLKTDATFAPEHKINMNEHQLTDVVTDETNESSTVSIQYVKDKLNRLNEDRSAYDLKKDVSEALVTGNMT